MFLFIQYYLRDFVQDFSEIEAVNFSIISFSKQIHYSNKNCFVNCFNFFFFINSRKEMIHYMQIFYVQYCIDFLVEFSSKFAIFLIMMYLIIYAIDHLYSKVIDTYAVKLMGNVIFHYMTTF